ncbi:hypothetical protein CEXT_809821 [Caerostris extrusa]|uniref:Uncharacterized protein n=1 Tax=Caerostris extrusa TaxID=172846 RepID=A0AAV4WZX2_CAEEX|nr:hypothetical protein CEXT_809821 [Caerostris extrusa]
MTENISKLEQTAWYEVYGMSKYMKTAPDKPSNSFLFCFLSTSITHTFPKSRIPHQLEETLLLFIEQAISSSRRQKLREEAKFSPCKRPCWNQSHGLVLNRSFIFSVSECNHLTYLPLHNCSKSSLRKTLFVTEFELNGRKFSPSIGRQGRDFPERLLDVTQLELNGRKFPPKNCSQGRDFPERLSGVIELELNGRKFPSSIIRPDRFSRKTLSCIRIRVEWEKIPANQGRDFPERLLDVNQLELNGRKFSPSIGNQGTDFPERIIGATELEFPPSIPAFCQNQHSNRLFSKA